METMAIHIICPSRMIRPYFSFQLMRAYFDHFETNLPAAGHTAERLSEVQRLVKGSTTEGGKVLGAAIAILNLKPWGSAKR
jgi:hypothetical protein